MPIFFDKVALFVNFMLNPVLTTPKNAEFAPKIGFHQPETVRFDRALFFCPSKTHRAGFITENAEREL